MEFAQSYIGVIASAFFTLKYEKMISSTERPEPIAQLAPGTKEPYSSGRRHFFQ